MNRVVLLSVYSPFSAKKIEIVKGKIVVTFAQSHPKRRERRELSPADAASEVLKVRGSWRNPCEHEALRDLPRLYQIANAIEELTGA